MKMNTRKLMILSAVGFALSFLVHFLTLTNVYLISNYVVLALTIGILIVWLQSSENIKWLTAQDHEVNPFSKMLRLSPVWVKYFLAFIVLYSLLNFAASVETKPNSGLFDFSVTRQKVRGISGIWLAFYTFGMVAAYARRKMEQHKQKDL